MQGLKLKIPPPIIALLAAACIWSLHETLGNYDRLQQLRSIVALALVCLAGFIDLWALGLFFSRKTTIDPRYPHKSARLVTDGIYAYSRNPMYLGLVLLLSAFSIWLGARFGMFVVLLFILYISRFQIKPEEAVLEQQFGEQYTAYKTAVRRWI